MLIKKRILSMGFLLAISNILSCFAAAKPVQIQFDFINAQQEINHPILATLRADEPGFNGIVYLNSTRGAVAPTYVKMQNGLWSGQVTVYEPGQRAQLLARWYNPEHSGSEVSLSNRFDVNNSIGQISADAKLSGTITDGIGNRIAQARIDLYKDADTATNPSRTAISDAAGHYLLKEVIPGKYFIQVRRKGYDALTQPVQLAAERTITKDLRLAPVYSKTLDGDKIPLLLVPGVTGSTTGDYVYTVYPRLPAVSPAWNSGELSLLDPFYQVGWHGVILKNKIIVNGLEAALIKQGYRLGDTLFEVPYDWTLPIAQISNDYLQPWIEYAKQVSGAKQVDIIAHSMGGLVVRAYIQSPNYQHDVRRFAVVGTPSRGASLSYYGWEGGDPITQDEATGEQSSVPPGYYYSNTLNYLGQSRISQSLCTFPWYSWKPKSCDYAAIYSFLHNQVLSVGQLMPTYKWALLENNKPHPISYDENMLLKALNHKTCLTPEGCTDPQGNLYRFKPPCKVFSKDDSKVQTALFSGIDNNTLQGEIVTHSDSKPFYQDGLPDGQEFIDQGDGTVVSDNVKIPGVHLPLSTVESQHAFLIKNYISALMIFIEGQSYRDQPSANSSPSQRVLVIETDGDVQPLLSITKADGKNLAVKTRTHYGFDRTTIALIDPPDANYDLTVESPLHKNYEFTLSYFNVGKPGNTRVNGARFETYPASDVNHYHFTLNTADPRQNLTYAAFAKAPSAVMLREVDHQLQLNWRAPVNQAASSIAYYEIFAKADNQPYFSKIGTAQTDHFELGSVFNTVDQTDYTYAVDAVFKDGTRTALAQLQ